MNITPEEHHQRADEFSKEFSEARYESGQAQNFRGVRGSCRWAARY
jgi:hypothetical protein